MNQVVSSESALTGWQEAIGSLGFKPAGTGGRRGIYMTRSAGPIVQAVGAMIAKNRGGAINIQLHLSMPLPCAEPPYEVILLSGDVSSIGVRVEPAWNHDPKFATWWPPEAAGDGLEALVQHGIPWLEHYSELAVLAELFENEFQQYDDETRKRQNESLLARLRRRIGMANQPPNHGYRQYLLWLAMIYESCGRIELARDRLEAFTATAQHLSVDEQGRLDRHREVLRERSS